MKRRERSESPEIPAGLRIYALGDLHGRADLFDLCAEAIARDLADFHGATLTLALGDMIDRGPESARLLARLRRGDFPTPVRALRGNHEQVMLDAQHDEAAFTHWMRFGGPETLASYGLDGGEGRAACARALSARAPADLAFLASLPFSHHCGDYFFCHAGVRPGVALADQTPADLISIRREFLASPLWHGKRVVHGHTPVAAPEILPNRIGLDIGAYASNRLGCAALEGKDLRLLEIAL